jgi:hypothetical protein
VGAACGHAGGDGHVALCGQFAANQRIIRSYRSTVKFALPSPAAMRGRMFGSSAAAKDATYSLQPTAFE